MTEFLTKSNGRGEALLIRDRNVRQLLEQILIAFERIEDALRRASHDR